MVSIVVSPQSEPFMLLNNLSQDAMRTNSNTNNCVDTNTTSNTTSSNTSSNVFRTSKSSSLVISSLSDNSIDNKLLQSVIADSCRILESKQTQTATLKSKGSRVRQNSLGRRQSLTVSKSSTIPKRRRSSMVQHGTDTTNTHTDDWVGSKQRTRIMSGLYGNNTTNDMSIEDIMRERKTNAVLKNPALFQMFQETLSHSVARYKPWGALNGFHTFLDECIRIPELKEQIIERRKEESNRFQSASRLLSFLSTRTQAASNDTNETKISGSDLFQRLTSRGPLLSSITNKTGSRTSSETHSPSAADDTNYDYMNDDDDDAQSFNEDFTKGWRTSLSPDKSDTVSTSRSSDGGSDLFLPNLDSITIPSRHSRTNDDEYESDVVSCSDDSSEYDGVNDWSDN